MCEYVWMCSGWNWAKYSSNQGGVDDNCKGITTPTMLPYRRQVIHTHDLADVLVHDCNIIRCCMNYGIANETENGCN